MQKHKQRKSAERRSFFIKYEPTDEPIFIIVSACRVKTSLLSVLRNNRDGLVELFGRQSAKFCSVAVSQDF